MPVRQSADALVKLEDCNATAKSGGLARNGNEVRLGMTLEAQGAGGVGTGAPRTAQVFHIATAVLGAVDAVDAGTGTLSVLGQQVQVRGWTVFGAPLRGGLSALRAGDVMTVYAFAGASGADYLATRIEPAPGARAYRLRGMVSGLDTTSRTFRIGGATLSYASASAVPATLADGQLVNVRLTIRSAGAPFAVGSFSEAVNRPGDAGSAQVDGLVTSFSNASSFSVNGMPVDASQAPIAPSQAPMTAGAFVSVQGRISGGTLLASQVMVLTPSAIDTRVFQVSGTVSGLDAAAKTFTVLNVEVDYSAAAFTNGTASGLANGTPVRVEGPLSADGSQLRAAQVTVR